MAGGRKDVFRWAKRRFSVGEKTFLVGEKTFLLNPPGSVSSAFGNRPELLADRRWAKRRYFRTKTPQDNSVITYGR